MRLVTISAFLAIFLCTVCPALNAGKDGPAAKIQTDQITADCLAGVWRSSDSTAKFRILSNDGQIVVEGWDSRDDEVFRITDVSLKGNLLLFTSTMPSTDWTIHNRCTIISDSEMKVSRSGRSTVPYRLIKE